MKADLLVAPCAYEAAKYAVTHWHYSRAMPTPPAHYIGVWEIGVFVGAVIFSRGSNNNGHKPYGIKMTEFCELSRIALAKHTSPVSRIVSIALKMLKATSPGVRLVVSYADPNHFHIGAIYQAGNWVYTGQTNEDFMAIDSRGRRWHSRQVSSTGVKRQYGELRRVPRHDECQIVPLLGKYRYLYPLDGSMREQIEALRKPYPKRERGETDNAAESNPQTGGASPTRSL